MTQWTEEAIAAELDGHFYQLRMADLGRVKVVDLKNPALIEERPATKLWTDDALRTLYALKRQGLTLDEIEVDMGRDRHGICQKWSRRREWMHKVFVPRADLPSLEEIIRVVCSIFQIGKNDFASNRRAKKITEARQVYYWIARECTKKSFPLIGLFAGNKDHSTVMHGVEKVDREMARFRPTLELCLFDLGLDWSSITEREAA